MPSHVLPTGGRRRRFLEGNGPVILWPRMLALLILGPLVLTVSTVRFRKRLEQGRGWRTT